VDKKILSPVVLKGWKDSYSQVVTSVYGPKKRVFRPDFWQEILDLKQKWDLPWILDRLDRVLVFLIVKLNYRPATFPAYFHKIANMRKRKNMILRLEFQGEIIEDEQHIIGIFQDRFKKIFSSKADEKWPGWVQLGQPYPKEA